MRSIVRNINSESSVIERNGNERAVPSSGSSSANGGSQEGNGKVVFLEIVGRNEPEISRSWGVANNVVNVVVSNIDIFSVFAVVESISRRCVVLSVEVVVFRGRVNGEHKISSSNRDINVEDREVIFIRRNGIGGRERANIRVGGRASRIIGASEISSHTNSSNRATRIHSDLDRVGASFVVISFEVSSNGKVPVGINVVFKEVLVISSDKNVGVGFIRRNSISKIFSLRASVIRRIKSVFAAWKSSLLGEKF